MRGPPPGGSGQSVNRQYRAANRVCRTRRARGQAQGGRSCCRRAVGSLSASELAFADDCFDKIATLRTIEHVRDLQLAFREIARVLRPGGRAVIAHPRKLLPSKLVGALAGSGLILSHSRLQLWPIPIVPLYVSVLIKPIPL